MTSRLPTLLVASISLILTGLSPELGQAQTRNSQKKMVEVMDPETMYSFTGVDGKGFLNRSPLNLPQPTYEGEETGIVGLFFSITPEGNVSEVRQESFALATANEEMIQSAREAVSQWKFTPVSDQRKDDEVRVIIQFNKTETGILYSVDGLYRIQGLVGRFPVELVAPENDSNQQGIVSAMLTVSPDGSVKFISKFYGAQPGYAVPPRLGIITHQALMEWKFDPISEYSDQEPEDQEILVQIRFMKLN